MRIGLARTLVTVTHDCDVKQTNLNKPDSLIVYCDALYVSASFCMRISYYSIVHELCRPSTMLRELDSP